MLSVRRSDKLRQHRFDIFCLSIAELRSTAPTYVLRLSQQSPPYDNPGVFIFQSINQSIKNLETHHYVGLDSPIRRRSRSLGSGHKGCFEQISFEMFSECLKSKTVSALADRLFQTVAEVCRKDRSAKADWARFTTSRF